MGNIDYKKVILGTGNYNSVKSGNRVAISENSTIRTYKKLMPNIDTSNTYNEELRKLKELRNKISELEYKFYKEKLEKQYIEDYYETRLRNLCIKGLMYSLKNQFGEGAILLSEEDASELSYRRLLADYVELETGIYIPEVMVDSDGKVKKLIPIRYKNRLNEVINKK